MLYFLCFSKIFTFLGLHAIIKESCLQARSYMAKKHDSDEFNVGNMETNILKKKLMYVLLTKNDMSLDPSRANGHFYEQYICLQV